MDSNTVPKDAQSVSRGRCVMKLTPKEQAICDEYSKRDEDGKVRCDKCPLAIDVFDCICYANIDGRTKEARQLERLR